MKHLLKYILLTTIIMQSAFAVVNVTFAPSQGTDWQRNSVVSVVVNLTNTANTAVYVQGVEVKFDYTGSKFKTVPTIIQDAFTGDLALNDIDLSTKGRVKYLKAKNSTSLTIPANSTVSLFTLRYTVTSANSEQGTPANFTFDGYYTNDISDTNSQSIAGTFSNSYFDIVADTTAPAATASRASGAYPAAFSVVLSSTDADLRYIKYTLDNSDPTPSSPTYNNAIPITANIGQVILKFRAYDWDGNAQAVQTSTYTVDTIAPELSNLAITPALVRAGQRVTVSFTVDEVLGADPIVRLNNQASATFTKSPLSSGLNYFYTRQLVGSEPQNTQSIYIAVRDALSNERTNTALTTNIDFTAPLYSPVAIGPNPVASGNQVSVTFNASERLDYNATTLNIMGRNDAQFVREYYDVGSGKWHYVYRTASGLNGTERTAIVVVHGSDIIGNRSHSNTNWGNLTVRAKDNVGNEGVDTSYTLEFEYEE